MPHQREYRIHRPIGPYLNPLQRQHGQESPPVHIKAQQRLFQHRLNVWRFSRRRQTQEEGNGQYNLRPKIRQHGHTPLHQRHTRMQISRAITQQTRERHVTAPKSPEREPPLVPQPHTRQPTVRTSRQRDGSSAQEELRIGHEEQDVRLNLRTRQRRHRAKQRRMRPTHLQTTTTYP